MNTATTQHLFSGLPAHYFPSKKERFRQKFQRSMLSCVRRGFSVEESFGMIWVETWEEISVSDAEQAELYEELIRWAKATLFEPFFPVIHNSYSPILGVDSANPLYSLQAQ